MADNMLTFLEALIHERKANPTPDSYTTSLFVSGLNKIAQKVGEEATEVIVAALGQSKQEQTAELADLFYHTLVLMVALDISLEDLNTELKRRHRK